jgi:hypothetical protein
VQPGLWVTVWTDDMEFSFIADVVCDDAASEASPCHQP